MDYSKPNGNAKKPVDYNPRTMAYKRNLKMATLGYDKLKQKQAELKAVQARHRAKQVVEVETANPEEPIKLETEQKEEPKTENLAAESQVSLRSRWNTLALAMLSPKARGSLTPVENPDSPTSKSRQSQSDGSDSEKKRIPPRLFDLVTRLSQSKEVMTRVAANKAPKQRSQKLEQSLQYGQHRREMAETYDSYNTLKDCRYLRLRSSDQSDTNPFDIKEIFGKKE